MGPLLETLHLSKGFPGVQAVDDVSFHLLPGEILALVGENGAGKSTLMQCLGGVYKPEAGEIWLDGKRVEFSSPYDALQLGIGMVFQELSLVEGLTIAENIFPNRQPAGPFDNIDWQKLHSQTKELLDRFDLELDPSALLKHLTMGQKQVIEVLKAISTEPKVLILDEPTSSLTESGANDLFENIRKLRRDGMSFIYITHKLNEVFELADRVMVMRDGLHVDTKPIGELSEQDLVGMMVGREIEDMYGEKHTTSENGVCFRVEAMTREEVFQDISFTLNHGEVLGFAGLIGAGRTAMARAIFGIDPKDSGEIFLEGKQVHINSPQDAIHLGIAYLTEDRKERGLFLDMTIKENLIAPSLSEFANKLDLLNPSKIKERALAGMEMYGINAPTINKKVISLSGGNQQKSMIAMWMETDPKVAFFDEPTRGVDVGARSEIYHKLREFARHGMGVIIISSDLTELIGMCDRILVMHRGSIMGEVLKSEFSEELIMEYAAGIRNHQLPGGSV